MAPKVGPRVHWTTALSKHVRSVSAGGTKAASSSGRVFSALSARSRPKVVVDQSVAASAEHEQQVARRVELELADRVVEAGVAHHAEQLLRRRVEALDRRVGERDEELRRPPERSDHRPARRRVGDLDAARAARLSTAYRFDAR